MQPLKTGPRSPRDALSLGSAFDHKGERTRGTGRSRLHSAAGHHGPCLDFISCCTAVCGAVKCAVCGSKMVSFRTTHPHRAVQGLEGPHGLHERRHRDCPANLAGRPKNAQSALELRLFPPPPAADPAICTDTAKKIRKTL